jgi:lipopolysaccharide transport system ATP-binding protein
MQPAIRVESLSKQYRLGAGVGSPYRTLREAVAEGVRGLWPRRGAKPSRPATEAGQPDSPDTLWALNEVSFEVRPGEVIGIIGRNGAGKSTLLKILSRITEPTKGRALVWGRVASLLEVGTGFHQELTGRENIYLNGSILGMSRKEIDRKLDAIVAFSEIESFLNTPVKRYSSGMYIRLAFAVAAHLEPEVLIVDEVLAVGDVEFQKKCLGKMQDVGRQGRTVLFVSHNLPALQSLCRRGIVLRHGRVVADAPVADAIREYLGSLEATACHDLSDRTDRKGVGLTRLRGIEIGDGAQEGAPVTMGRPVRIVFHLTRPLPGLSCVFTIVDQHGYGLAKFNSWLATRHDSVTDSGSPQVTCFLDEWLLAPGRYRVDVTLYGGGEVQDSLEGAAFFDVERAPVHEREPPRSTNDWKVALPHRWSLPR